MYTVSSKSWMYVIIIFELEKNQFCCYIHSVIAKCTLENGVCYVCTSVKVPDKRIRMPHCPRAEINVCVFSIKLCHFPDNILFVCHLMCVKVIFLTQDSSGDIKHITACSCSMCFFRVRF